MRDWKRFASWSKENGFSLDSELELLDQQIIVGTKRKLDKEVLSTEKGFRTAVHETIVESDVESDWITTIGGIRWTKQDTLARRGKQPVLTPYGMRRLAKRRKQKKITAFGETKAASDWAKDSRAKVSDKIITERLAKKWTAEEAITTPARQRPIR